MKKFYLFSLMLVGIFCMMLTTSLPAQAQWRMVSQRNAAYAFYITKGGNFLMSDYLYDLSGGIYVSTNKGSFWNKADIIDRGYNNFIEAGKYVFASGMGTELARSADGGKTWEMVSFAEVLAPYVPADEMDYDVVYAMAYHNGKLFVGDFNGGGIIYSEDFGETWKMTKRENLFWVYEDEETGKVEEYMDNFYNMVSFKGKLYAFGMVNVYEYDETANDWFVLRGDSNFMAVSTIFKDKLYCGRSVMNETTEIPFLECTSDGEDWVEVPRPENQIDNNIRALASDDKNIYVGLQSRGIYYTPDAGQTWVNISKGLPNMNPENKDLYLSPLKFAVTDEFLYVVLYDDPMSPLRRSGLYRYPKKNLPTGVENVVADQQIFVDGDVLFVGQAEQVAIYDLSGKQCNVVVNNGRVDLKALSKGCYLYQVTVNGQQQGGKFLLK